jgi:hypothetical protein
LSGIVETPKGLYLLMRLPIDPDMVADSSGKTLRYRTAFDYLYQMQINGWGREMAVEREKAFELIDVQAVAKGA